MAILKLNYSFNMALFSSYDIPDDRSNMVYKSNSGFAVKDVLNNSVSRVLRD